MYLWIITRGLVWFLSYWKWDESVELYVCNQIIKYQLKLKQRFQNLTGYRTWVISDNGIIQWKMGKSRWKASKPIWENATTICGQYQQMHCEKRWKERCRRKWMARLWWNLEERRGQYKWRQTITITKHTSLSLSLSLSLYIYIYIYMETWHPWHEWFVVMQIRT